MIKYEWFNFALKIHKIVPNNNKNFIKLLQIKEIKNIVCNDIEIMLDLVRQRRTKVIRYLWKTKIS